MAILSARGLSKSFGTRMLFCGVSFDVNEKDKIGFVGANGTGKTTLIEILLGNTEPDEGEVNKQKLLKIGCLSQAPKIREGESVYEFALDAFSELVELERAIEEINNELLVKSTDTLLNKQHSLQEEYERAGGLTYKSRARSSLLGLGFSEAELNMEALSLSVGQQTRAMLARLLMSGAGLLLLDEPTNHLDIRASEWLEAYLKSYNGAYIVISHDRYFLNNTTDRTFELASSRFFMSNGNYSAHMQKREDAKEAQRREYYNTKREIRRIYGIVEQQRRWNRERNIRTAESKLKQIAKLSRTLVEPEKEAGTIHFSFKAKKPGGNDVLMAEGLGKAYGEKRLFSDLSLHIRAGERVFLLGANGCGKTTLMKILMGLEQADEGFSFFGAEVEPAYYEQSMRALRPDNTALGEVMAAFPRLDTGEIRNALAAFLFKGDDVEKKIEKLSGGEKARIQLLKLMLTGSNMLLLDEPTNHLDIGSRENLERSLEEYEGAMLIITHDRYLTNRIADRVLYMSENGLTETIGGYDAFVQAQNSPSRTPDEPEAKQKNDYHIKKDRQKVVTMAKTALRKAEEAVSSQEEAILELENELLRLAHDYQAAARVNSEIEKRRKELDKYYQAWELAEIELQELEDGE